MSITTQPTVNVLNGSLACAFNDGRPTGSNELVPSIVGNALFTPTWDVVESPPFGVSFNGALFFFNNWGHFGQLYVSTNSYEVSTNNFFLANFPGFKDLGGGQLGDQPKVLKIFGVGTNFPGNTGDRANTSNSRTAGNIPLVGMSETEPAGAFPDSGSWCRSEWWQGVSVPNGATTVKFGAYVRVAEDDDFRARNCGGVYLKTNGPVQTIIDAIVVKRDEDTINLVTGGMAAGLNSIQQWSGISATVGSSPFSYPLRWNDPVQVNSIDYVNTSDHRQFRKIEKEITLNQSTDTLGIGLFFGENQANLDESGTPTGSIQFYNPFVQFFDSSGDLIITKTQTKLVLKHTGYRSARVTINGLAFDYDGTDGLEFPLPIKTPNEFNALFNAIGTDAIFNGNPTITGGTYTGDIDESESGNLAITWDGTSDEIVITTNGIKD